ncbi:MAG: non-ribosomal peptide synthetase, partial [bacterium]|nr:non-ribosomal peptide synthetase [bacterium]
SPTIRGLAEYISDTGMGDYQPLEAVEQREYYALSSRQNRLYVTYQLNPDSIAYNIPAVMSLEGPVDTHRLETVFQTLIRRHESFRTSFELKDDKPVQRIHREVAFETGIHTLPPPGGNPATGGLQELATAVKTFIRPFDLSRPPLLRVGVVAAPVFFPGHLVMMDIHHIISDGISETLVINEFIRLYEGEEPVPLKFQYKDYCRWQQLRSDSDVYKKQESFWLKQFEGKLPLLNMPIDFPRTGEQRLDGDHLQFRLGEGESDLLYEMAQAEGMTLFMVLLAIYNVLLAQVAHQEDIVVGVPHGGRNHPDLDNIVGFFINTLVLRNYPLQECTFREFLESIRTRTLEAFENQEYQFDDLVKNLLQEREAARNPLFDVMFTLDNFRDRSTPPNRHGIRRLNLEEIDYNISRFDLILHALEQEGGICFIFEYSTGLYKRETIEGFAEYFKNIAASVIRNPDQRISEIEIVSEEKKKMLMEKIKINEESKIVKEHAMKNKAKGQTVDLSADFNY